MRLNNFPSSSGSKTMSVNKLPLLMQHSILHSDKTGAISVALRSDENKCHFSALIPRAVSPLNFDIRDEMLERRWKNKHFAGNNSGFISLCAYHRGHSCLLPALAREKKSSNLRCGITFTEGGEESSFRKLKVCDNNECRINISRLLLVFLDCQGCQV